MHTHGNKIASMVDCNVITNMFASYQLSANCHHLDVVALLSLFISILVAINLRIAKRKLSVWYDC